MSSKSKFPLVEGCREIFDNLNIPLHSLLYIHVRVKGLHQIFGDSYKDVSIALLHTLNDIYKPLAIFIPQFTYTFTQSGVFHRLFSMSEVGRFSEEIRKLPAYTNSRTCDPVFSVLDINRFLDKMNINYMEPFEKGGIFDFLTHRHCMVMNIGLDELTSTHIHYIERINNVPYRYHKRFEGVLYDNDTHYKKISYNYFVRDLKLNPKWNRSKIENVLSSQNVLSRIEKNGIVVRIFDSSKAADILSREISLNKCFLID